LRLSFSGLRAGILTQLIFLIVAAMLLVNVVMMKFSERNLIQAKEDTGRLLIRALEQDVGHLLSGRKRSLNGIDSNPVLRRNVTRLLEGGGFSELVISDIAGSPVFSTGLSLERRERGLNLAMESMRVGTQSVRYSGTTWGVLWLGSRDISISAPLMFEGRPIGGVTVSASLDAIYQQLRKSEKAIFFYILLDTIILALVGIYLLSRIVVRPIHRLLKLTEGYKDGDIIPSIAESSKNEIGNLSRSLSNMIKRLDDNKKELKAHISSLESANEELKQARDEIIRSEKLASVGRLAAGVAHEIGNPIGIVLGYLEMIRKGDIQAEDKNDFLARVESEITRINRIITQLLDFSRPSSEKEEEGRIHELIMEAVNILKPQPMMDGIRVNFELNASMDRVLADHNQLMQVFLNIIMNAADVLVREDLPNGEGPEKRLTIRSQDSGDFIELRFIDNGPGIPKEEHGRIFDPFYTTKEPGKGTGLGLSVCYRIVEGQGGTISAESSLGEGTAIVINFPIDNRNGGRG